MSTLVTFSLKLITASRHDEVAAAAVSAALENGIGVLMGGGLPSPLRKVLQTCMPGAQIYGMCTSSWLQDNFDIAWESNGRDWSVELESFERRRRVNSIICWARQVCTNPQVSHVLLFFSTGLPGTPISLGLASDHVAEKIACEWAFDFDNTYSTLVSKTQT